MTLPPNLFVPARARPAAEASTGVPRRAMIAPSPVPGRAEFAPDRRHVAPGDGKIEGRVGAHGNGEAAPAEEFGLHADDVHPRVEGDVLEVARPRIRARHDRRRHRGRRGDEEIDEDARRVLQTCRVHGDAHQLTTFERHAVRGGRGLRRVEVPDLAVRQRHGARLAKRRGRRP
jgi:hypothetical protein